MTRSATQHKDNPQQHLLMQYSMAKNSMTRLAMQHKANIQPHLLLLGHLKCVWQICCAVAPTPKWFT